VEASAEARGRITPGDMGLEDLHIEARGAAAFVKKQGQA
jgi:hypothetical protein